MSISDTLLGEVKDLDRAESDVAIARQRLANSLLDVQARFTAPKLIEAALDELKTRSVDLAHHTRDAVRERPLPTILSGASLSLLLFARPLCRVIRRVERVLQRVTAPRKAPAVVPAKQ